MKHIVTIPRKQNILLKLVAFLNEITLVDTTVVIIFDESVIAFVNIKISIVIKENK
ncbi:hypothetical protein D3C72_1937320 [compost metagenome]